MDEVTAPTVAGYTPSQPSVEAINTPTVDTELSDVTIDYTANDQTVIIKFIDDDNRDSEGNSAPIQVGSDITESGKLILLAHST